MTASAKLPGLYVEKIRVALEALADPASAKWMAAYLKTDMPFYGVHTPDRVRALREIIKANPIEDRDTYEDVVLALWNLPHRDEKYAALHVAFHFKAFVTHESLPLYERLIREGAWWDLVDGVATQCVGEALLKNCAAVSPVLDRWIEDENMWIRRAAIISQLLHKKKTDEKKLFSYCLARAHEKEFFIRKAVGWALRDYAKTAPHAVAKFLLANRDKLSSLSFREAAKHLDLASSRVAGSRSTRPRKRRSSKAR